MSEKDISKIPSGGFCYSVVELQEGEVLCLDLERFGKELREYIYRHDTKEVLCPYWHKTDYGMVRCDYLCVESLMEDEVGAREKAILYYGSEARLEEADDHSLIYDEIKICGINEDTDDT